MNRVLHISICLLLLNAQWVCSEPISKKAWWEDKITFSCQVLPLINVQGLSDGQENPDNDFMKLERRSWEFHLRPDFHFKDRSLKLGIKPRFIGAYKQFEDGTQEGRTDEETDIFINEGYIQWHLLPSAYVSLQRKNLQWGPGFLSSPSNPFYRNTGKSIPHEELGGKDFAQLSYIPNASVAISALANIGEGEFKVEGSLEEFQEVYALKTDLTLENVSFSPVVSYEKDTFRLGGYGSWTASDALLLFMDFSVAKGSKGRYVELSSESPLGSEFKESYDDSSKVLPEILIGGSYTFLNGTTLYMEYLYYGPGYTSSEADRYYDLLSHTSEPYLYEGDDEDLLTLKSFAESQLYFAYQNNLTFLRRNYVMIYANRSWDKVELTPGWVQNIDDGSFYALNFVNFRISDSFNVFTNILLYSCDSRTEYNSPFEYIATLGLKYYF